jgi:hypothetical protein
VPASKLYQVSNVDTDKGNSLGKQINLIGFNIPYATAHRAPSGTPFVKMMRPSPGLIPSTTILELPSVVLIVNLMAEI